MARVARERRARPGWLMSARSRDILRVSGLFPRPPHAFPSSSLARPLPTARRRLTTIAIALLPSSRTRAPAANPSTRPARRPLPAALGGLASCARCCRCCRCCAPTRGSLLLPAVGASVFFLPARVSAARGRGLLLGKLGQREHRGQASESSHCPVSSTTLTTTT